MLTSSKVGLDVLKRYSNWFEEERLFKNKIGDINKEFAKTLNWIIGRLEGNPTSMVRGSKPSDKDLLRLLKYIEEDLLNLEEGLITLPKTVISSKTLEDTSKMIEETRAYTLFVNEGFFNENENSLTTEEFKALTHPSLKQYAGVPTVLRTLPVGTRFYCHNGAYHGRVIKKDGEKRIAVNDEPDSNARIITEHNAVLAITVLRKFEEYTCN